MLVGGVLWLAEGAPAQVPAGHLAIPHLAAPAYGYLSGGVVLLDATTGASTPLAGLPPDLVGTSAPQTGVAGSNAILIDDRDGSLVVASYTDAPAVPLNLYRITPSAGVGLVAQTIALGTTGTIGGGIDQMAWLSPDRIVVCYRGIATRTPVRGLAVVDLVAGTLTPIAVSPPPARSLALAVSRDGTTIYFDQTTATGSDLVKVPSIGGASTTVASLPDGIYQLAVEHGGHVYASTYPNDLYDVDPTLGSVTMVHSVSQPNAMTIDRTTGHVTVLSVNPGLTTGEVLVPGAWTSTPIVGVPNVAAAGVAVRSSMVPYGSAVPSPNGTSQWQCAPNPGGAPRIGNLGFSMTAQLAGAPGQLAVVALSLGAIPATSVPPFLGILVDPTLVGVIAATSGNATCTVPLPLPATLPHLDVYAQAFHFDGVGSWLGSEGLRVSVY